MSEKLETVAYRTKRGAIYNCGNDDESLVLRSQAEAILAERDAENRILFSKTEDQSAVILMAKTALDEVQRLIEESRGVYGLHLNGDESPWSELEQGGRFERLGALPDALAAINALPEVAEQEVKSN